LILIFAKNKVQIKLGAFRGYRLKLLLHLVLLPLVPYLRLGHMFLANEAVEVITGLDSLLLICLL
jgi:hypothetical protein